MRNFIRMLLFVFAYSPFYSFSQVSNGNDQNYVEFNSFLEKFKLLKLPKKLPFDSLEYYNDHQEVTTKGSIKMVKTQYLNITDSKFLPKVNYNKKGLKLKFLAIYKFKLNEKYWAIIYDKCLEADDPVVGLGDWLILGTFDNSGNMIDSLSLTGYTYESVEQSSEISKEFKIETKRFETTPFDYKKHSVDSKEIKSEYNIDKVTGRIIILKSEFRKVKYNAGLYEPLEPFKPITPKR
jgi:hypothetical protein